MGWGNRGVRLALVAVTLFSQALLAQQTPGQELKFDSSGTQPSTLPIRSPTIVTPAPAPATDKITSPAAAPAPEHPIVQQPVTAMLDRKSVV
jgi:hypothetical protein